MQTKPFTLSVTAEQAALIKTTSQAAALAQHLSEWPETMDYDAVLAAIASPDGIPDEIVVYDVYGSFENGHLADAIDEAYLYLEGLYTNLLADVLKDMVSAFNEAVEASVQSHLDRETCQLTLTDAQHDTITRQAQESALSTCLSAWPSHMAYAEVLAALKGFDELPAGFAGYPCWMDLSLQNLAESIQATCENLEGFYTRKLQVSLTIDHLENEIAVLREALQVTAAERDAAVKALEEAGPRHPDLSYADLATGIINADDADEHDPALPYLAHTLRNFGFSGSLTVEEELG